MGIGFRELLIILAIALLIFGAKKLRNIGAEESGKKLAQDERPDADFSAKRDSADTTKQA
jgi:TatA/E family protein of Tat protein translocase